MQNRSPQLYLYAVLVLNSIVVAMLCYFCRQLNVSKEQIFPLIMLSIFGYLAISILIILASRSLQKNLLEPQDRILATIVASLPQPENEQLSMLRQSLDKAAIALASEIQSLRQAERTIVDYSPELVCSLDENARILELNANAENIWKYANLNLMGASFLDLAAPKDKQLLEAHLNDCRKDAEHAAIECTMLDAEKNAMDFHWVFEWSPKSKNYYCVGKDITSAKEVERLRAEITAMVSHDLRAPISSLSFFLEGLLSSDFGSLNQDGKSHVIELQDSLQHILQLINQLLDAERIDSGQMKMDIKIVPLDFIIESSVQLLRPLAEQKRIEIQVNETQEMAFADHDRTVQVLNNLLSNAIKWSPESSQIEINISHDGACVKIAVKDHGPGIPVEQWAKIFDRFKTGDREADTACGAGLGLYISKTLADLQGGGLNVYSVPGKGATFTLTLKRATDKDLPGYLD